MKPDPQQAKEIFLAALELAAGQRRAYLDLACAGNAELRARVEKLLQAHEREDSSIAPAPQPTLNSIPEAPEDATSGATALEKPGAIIGPYKLLQQIGEGGMGIVFMAEQTQPVQRKVALKIIKPGLDSRQVIARFE